MDQGYQASYLGEWGQMCFGAERARPGRRASDHRQQQHIIRYHRETRETNAERTARQTEFVPSHRIWGAGAKRKWLHARSPPGAHDHIAEGPSSHSKPGGGHWLLAIGCGIAGSQNVAGRNAGPSLLAYAIQRITLCAPGSSGGASEAFRDPAARSLSA